MPNRRACDRCHRYKEKCVFEDIAETCTLCQRSGSSCTTSRSQLRQGRRPKASPLGPHGSVQVWDVMGVYDTSIGTNTSQNLIESNICQASLGAPGSKSEAGGRQIQASTAPSSSSFPAARITPTSDEEFEVNATSTLVPGHISQIKALNHSSTYESESQVSYVGQPYIELLSLPWIFDLDQFSATHDLFMFGVSFAQRLYDAVHQSYVYTPVLLHDILIAISPALIQGARKNRGLPGQVDIAKGTSSLQRLRITRITGSRDALAIITLGQALAIFDLLTYSMSSTSILRYSLSSIQPWYEELSKNPSFDPVTITPILWDAVQCLVKREVPVIKYFSRDPHVVDRMAGLCTTLLPIFYDLCVASSALKCQVQSDSHSEINTIRHIKQRLLSWTPEPPDDLASTFTAQEILKMEAQASMYRTAGLLICHRLLNPIGTLEDFVASSYAKNIMADFSNYSNLVTPGTRLQNITFPVLLATFEIPNLTKEIRSRISSLSVPRASILAFVDYVWMRRRGGYTGSIFDLIDHGPNFVVTP